MRGSLTRSAAQKLSIILINHVLCEALSQHTCTWRVDNRQHPTLLNLLVCTFSAKHTICYAIGKVAHCNYRCRLPTYCTSKRRCGISSKKLHRFLLILYNPLSFGYHSQIDVC